MKALVTGASSGIGRSIALELSKNGYDIIATGRKEEKLAELKTLAQTDVQVITADLQKQEECFALYEQVKDEEIEILINNAGFGVFGEFDQTDLMSELDMLHVNIDALHILTKLFLKDFLAKDKGYILNVASSAGFFPGPLFSSYYASKSYVLKLSMAIREELSRKGSNVYIGALCPGPVATEFNKRAKAAGFAAKALSPEYVAQYTLKKMFANKARIVPGAQMQLFTALGPKLPLDLQARIVYATQRKKK